MDVQQRCVLVKPDAATESKQGHQVFPGISAESAGAQGLCLHLIEIPPGGRARAHLHAGHETAIYVIRGEAISWYGDRLEHSLTVGAGEFLYIPAGVPHLPVNASDAEPVVAVVARTDPNEQESVVLLPELDQLPHLIGGGGGAGE